MLQLNLSNTFQNLKTVSFYVLAVLVLAYGNAFRNYAIAIIWMLGVALSIGYLHRNQRLNGAKYFLLPALLVMIYGLIVNFQMLFIAEAATIAMGYFIGSRQWFSSTK